MLSNLNNTPPETPFPDPAYAETEPNGLLAIGGDLSITRLINAYRHGIFPWFNTDEPILWWSPDPRMVLEPTKMKISRSLRRTIRSGKFHTTIDQAFSDVVQNCAAPRAKQPGTWILPEMKTAYENLFAAGKAHSVEVWETHEGEQNLVGGLYGVAIGKIFFGESMFFRKSDASKVALVFLCERLEEWGFPLMDCQVYSNHLASLGAVEIPRAEFQEIVAWGVNQPDSFGGNSE